MPAYKAPLRDMQFVLHEVLDVQGHHRSLGRSDITTELIDSILSENAKFSEQVIAPLNVIGDREGVVFCDGRVATPPGFRKAYRQYHEDGWASSVAGAEFGGQSLPASLEIPFSEMLSAANLAWRTYSGLNMGAILTLQAHASDTLKADYLPRLVSGEWLATMCLTEPQAGTDLGLLRVRAEPTRDGAYAITGTKMFITGGEHDLTPNIVHLVLARLPNAPAGSKGISLFLVPKFLTEEDAASQTRNGVVCSSIESKMGIKGSATCVLDFSEAKGWLVGKPHSGLACMFTMMNHARLGVGVQGLGLAELALQGSVAYARDRRQGRSPEARRQTSVAADPIIGHPDVRRMLLTQKALIEGCRMLAYFIALQLDIAHDSNDAQARENSEDLLALLTPIAKAFMTDTAVDCAGLGIQIHGGHGYITEVGMEQLLRDARILPIYEGTNGVQAFDLLARKVLGSEGRLLHQFSTRISDFCEHRGDHGSFVGRLRSLSSEWTDLTRTIASAAREHPEEIGAAAHDFLQFSGLVCLAWCWAQMADIAREKIDQGHNDGFYRAKIEVATFYYDRVLPRAAAHAAAIRSGARSLMQIDAAHFQY